MSEEAKTLTEAERAERDIASLRMRGYFVRQNPNRYDRKDMVERIMDMMAGSLKFGAYRVRDPETDAWGPIQFHLLYDNHVMAILSEQSAKLFVTMYQQVMDKQQASTSTPSE